MISKRFIFSAASILLVLALLLFAIRSEHIFKSVYNYDYFKEYENSPVETSLNYENIRVQGIEKFLIIYDSEQDVSESITNNVKQVLNYMKKDVITVDVRKFKGNFDSYRHIIMVIEDIELFNYFDQLFQYVQRGGNVLFAQRPYEDSSKFSIIYRKLGIYERGPVQNVYGLALKSNLLIKGLDIKIGESFSTYAITAHLEEDCKIHAVSGKNNPLIWERNYGKGDIIFVNGDFLALKQYRGLIAGMISNLGNEFIYPIINAKVTFIDDFPAPIPEGYNDKIYSDFRLTTPEFYREVWWPDMLKLSKIYNLKYTGLLIESYNDNVETNFYAGRNMDNRRNLMYFGRELLKSGGELGIHGYNHQSLALEGFMKEDLGYKSWKNEASMAESMNEVYGFIKSVYENYSIRSYVPPSNILSPEGRYVIKYTLPDLKVISSLYIVSNNADAYMQEFDMGDDGILNFPRFSSGYNMTEWNKWNIYSGITLHGVFSHFIHPDDLLDPERSDYEGWSTLGKSFEKIIEEVTNKFEWIRSSTASEGAVELKRYLDGKVTFKYDENSINGYCKDFKNNMFFILRTDRKINNNFNCHITKIDENIYLVKAEKYEFRIGLGD